MGPLGCDLPSVVDGDATCENGKVPVAYFGNVWRASKDQNNVQLAHFIISLWGICFDFRPLKKCFYQSPMTPF
jgi:hypothetical protein